MTNMHKSNETDYLEQMYNNVVPTLLMRNDPKTLNQYLLAYVMVLNQVSIEEKEDVMNDVPGAIIGMKKRSELRSLVLEAVYDNEYMPVDDHFQQLSYVIHLLTV